MERGRRRTRSTGRIKTITLAFALMIGVGTLLLSMPFAKAGPGHADLLTALFTATSATCVTGLVVVDTATYWSFGGRLVILMLIQIGGLGVMMLAAMVAMTSRRRMSLGQQMTLSTSLNLFDVSGVLDMARMIFFGTFLIEGLGAVGVTLCLLGDFGFWGALERGVFISISAFCNAGFDNLGVGGQFGSITAYGGCAPLLLILAALIVVGGIGFYVWRDLFDYVRRKKRLSLHTKLVLTTTGILLTAGTVGFLLTETRGTILSEQPFTRFIQAFFQSVTTRTAGFDHLSQGSLTSPSLALSDILMIIGGSPGSVAGGVKTTTAAIIAMSAFNSFRGRPSVTAFGRTIPRKTIAEATSLFFLAGASAVLGAFVLSISDGISFEVSFYECISAIATVGLSCGITPTLGLFSKSFLIVLMFLGRVGIVTVGSALFLRSWPDESIRLPEGSVLIG